MEIFFETLIVALILFNLGISYRNSKCIARIEGWKNQIIAESEKTTIIEGNHYFPPESINKDFLQKSKYTTECPWKGTAHYYDIVVGKETNKNAAWYYPKPKDGSIDRVGTDFTNYVAFWNEVAVE